MLEIRAGEEVLSVGGSTYWIKCSISQRGASHDGALQSATRRLELQLRTRICSDRAYMLAILYNIR